MTATIIILIIGAAVVAFILLRKKKQASTPNPSAPPSQPPDHVWRPMLGDAVPGPIKRTPRYRIQYQSNGFDTVRPKQIEKTVEWLKNEGAGHLVDQFVTYANEVGKIPEWIDAAYEKNFNQYQACGGKFAEFATRNDPSTIYVEVMAIPMYDSHSKRYAGGMALRDNKTIRCVVIATANMKDNPSTVTIEGPATADLRRFPDYAKWEVGNTLMLRYGYVPKRIPEDEWGDSGPPCS